jgi:hypothetical protein
MNLLSLDDGLVAEWHGQLFSLYSIGVLLVSAILFELRVVYAFAAIYGLVRHMAFFSQSPLDDM